ncbi:MAG: hypothetical protein V4734_03475, partial [Terriglobus sp.]
MRTKRSTIAPENAHNEDSSFDFGFAEEEPLALAANADTGNDTSFDFSFDSSASMPSLFDAPQQTVSFNPFEASKQQ